MVSCLTYSLALGLMLIKNLLGIGVAARNLAQLWFIITHQEVNAIFSSIFNLGNLFANTTVDDIFRGNTMALHQFQFRLNYKDTQTKQYSIKGNLLCFFVIFCLYYT